MKNVLAPLAKNLLVPLGLIASDSATGAATEVKYFGSAMVTLTFANEELNVVMKFIQSQQHYLKGFDSELV